MATAIARHLHSRASMRQAQESDSEMDLTLTCEYAGSDPELFKATVLWDKIVMHLERSVKRGRRSQGLRIFVNCFPGSKAVECLEVYLNTILPKTVQRSQVVVLCDKLLLTGVIEDVRKGKDKTTFRESKLYRFTGKHFWEAEPISSMDEGSLGLPKSRSDENLAQQALQPKRRKAHSRGYTSDSTLASPMYFGRKKRSNGLISGRVTPRSLHSSQGHSRWARPPHLVPRPPTQLPTIHSPLEQASTAQVSSRNSLERRSRRSGEQVADRGSVLGKRLPFLRKDKTKPICIPVDTQSACITPLSPTKELPESPLRDSAEKRYSLQMKNALTAREKEVMMQTCRNDVRQRLVVVNADCMHRSHSFSSSASLNTGGGESPDNARKWIVYGYV